MKFDRCKFGFHDFEYINDTNLVKDAIHKKMLAEGYVRYRSGNYTKTIYRDGSGGLLSIPCDGGLFTMSINDCFSRHETKVCVICGEIKKNYKIQDILNRVDNVIAHYTKIVEREIKARQLRNRNEKSE